VKIGPLGVWSGELRFKRDRGPVLEAVAELEELGYGPIWLPGGSGTGQPIFDVVGEILDATRTVTVATGIVSIWIESAEDAGAAQLALRERHRGRFLLGLGVSHAPLVDESLRPLLSKPRTAMAQYLDRLDAATGGRLAEERILAALGPRMLDLARERSLGSHPYNVTPEHTAAAREALGPEPLLCPEQAVVLESDPARAREIAREFLAVYLGLPNYTNNLLRHGLDEADLADGGSDRLVDAVVAWGDEDAVAERVRAHRAAGADHVCLQVLSGRRGELPLPEWRRLAGI
jgi:probable F420-dependent oxidoreductase